MSGEINRSMSKYTALEKYISDIDVKGLQNTWDDICKCVLNNGTAGELPNIKNFGDMYEIGLARLDKSKKKNNGQYYTPDDVALIMGEWLSRSEGENICDVACGTGKLILAYLDYVGKEKARTLLQEGRVYLYDYDETALKICKTSLLAKYGLDLAGQIHAIHCDFLDKDVVLPENCKTISNPPYGKIGQFGDNWNLTDVIRTAREWYSSFMEKICEQSKSAVIITPFSFIAGGKFYVLRKEMCALGGGFIVAFDNIPGNIFCGRKQGIFNTNMSNSVRAAITVFHKSDKPDGFKISPLIRFKNGERRDLLKTDVLELAVNAKKQIVNEENKAFKKIDGRLQDLYDAWVGSSSYLLKDLVAKNKGKYPIYVPNTCRYNTVAASKRLERKGLIILNVDNPSVFYFLYCFLNSSFPYWWWRIYDGGITYPVNLLNNLPVPYNLLGNKEKEEFKEIAIEMAQEEEKYTSIKINAGTAQENIKFPKRYRDLIDNAILKLIESESYKNELASIHDNSFFRRSSGQNTVLMLESGKNPTVNRPDLE